MIALRGFSIQFPFDTNTLSGSIYSLPPHPNPQKRFWVLYTLRLCAQTVCTPNCWWGLDLSEMGKFPPESSIPPGWRPVWASGWPGRPRPSLQPVHVKTSIIVKEVQTFDSKWIGEIVNHCQNHHQINLFTSTRCSFKRAQKFKFLVQTMLLLLSWRRSWALCTLAGNRGHV